MKHGERLLVYPDGTNGSGARSGTALTPDVRGALAKWKEAIDRRPRIITQTPGPSADDLASAILGNCNHKIKLNVFDQDGSIVVAAETHRPLLFARPGPGRGFY